MADLKNPPGTLLQQRLVDAPLKGRLLVMQICGDEGECAASPETFFCVSVVPEQYGGLTITLRPVAIGNPVVVLGSTREAPDG